ncbi:MAG: response regulator transcription factor [Acutalibacteraceae bacterium]|nr:response regulator transcription factor [Clostridia bacterium]MEE1127146.1 response regulator transcription factor [Acutalibacteraceae bacterium]MBQ2000934.1 response regulator transcription factor [Clostridia bacterium]MBQ2319090.1 response regulator transcription factor [Clostridia bacterium]MBQ2387423.1 response regulator transcription factor [Clostridia bacterium]
MERKIIVADDEQALRELVADYFEAEGYTVLQADDGDVAVSLMEENPDTDAVIMDVMMPELDGWAACRKIRTFSTVPVLMLTARSQEFDQLMGFESGADDYVTKPFSPAVLVKRIDALIRRASGATVTESGLKINAEAYTASIDGVSLDLTVKEFELLRMLNDNKGRVFTRDQLLDAIWGFDYDGDIRTVDSHIARLRVKLGEYGNAHLKTIYGVGYKLEN